jgi:hypothetical protein
MIWCDVITNSNLTTIDNDLFPRLKEIKETVQGFGAESYSKIRLFHQSLENNLDVSAYDGLLSSGLYYDLNFPFQNNLMFTRELITKVGTIFSNQEFLMATIQDDMSKPMAEHKRKVIYEMLDVLEIRLTQINDELKKLKTNITIYKRYANLK